MGAGVKKARANAEDGGKAYNPDYLYRDLGVCARDVVICGWGSKAPGGSRYGDE
jgi:hypothetical protein